MTASDLAPQPAQSARQSSVRTVTGTTNTYEGDWHALFDLAGIPAGPFDGRMLAWINLKLSAAYAEINGAMQALATAAGGFNFSSLGAFDASTGGGGSTAGQSIGLLLALTKAS